MKLLAHRGYWMDESEKNSFTALRRALEAGYGFESDIRDWNGQLVISHNIADSSCQLAKDVFQILHDYQDQFCFAINIKSDGLKELLLDQLNAYHLTNYFIFDMSVPQMVEYEELGLTYFTRQSEVESAPILYQNSAGIWIDGFWDNDWITEELLRGHIDNGKKVCIVSPELHGRDSSAFWKRLVSFSIDFDQVMLCTDRPAEASQAFKDLLW